MRNREHQRDGTVDYTYMVRGKMRTQTRSIVNRLRSTLAPDRLSVLLPTFKSMCTINIYTFRVRDGGTGKWRDSRRKMTIANADKRYGEGNYEVIESSKELRLRSLLRLFRSKRAHHRSRIAS